MDFIVWSLKHFKAIWRVLIALALSVPSSHKSLPKKTEYRYPERDIARQASCTQESNACHHPTPHWQPSPSNKPIHRTQEEIIQKEHHGQ